MLAGVVSGLAFLAMMTAVLFAAAGRSDLPMFWCYLAVWLVFLPIGTLTMDPELIRERMHPGPGARDYGRTLAFIPLTLAQFVVAGIDVGRFHWSDTVPLAVQTAGLLMTAAALVITTWASAVNRFFSSVIRIQTERGHQVVTSGPYRVVRHPAYACTPFLFVGTGLALGSWLAALVGLLLFVAVLSRVVEEDRILLEELEGYAAYARKVRYRLIPGVW